MATKVIQANQTADVADMESATVTSTYTGDDQTNMSARGVMVFFDVTAVGGTGASATAVLTADAVSSITVDAGGSGYGNAPAITFTGGGGADAAATATVVNGVITGFTVTNGGSSYETPPTVVIGNGLGSDTVTLAIQAKDPASSTYTALLTGAAVNSISHTIYRIYPELTAAANSIAKDALPRTWRIKVTHSGTSRFVYSTGYSLLN